MKYMGCVTDASWFSAVRESGEDFIKYITQYKIQINVDMELEVRRSQHKRIYLDEYIVKGGKSEKTGVESRRCNRPLEHTD